MESDDYFPELLLQLTYNDFIADFAAAFVTAFILLCFAAILSAAENAIFYLSQEEVSKAEESHSARDKIIVYLSDHPRLLKASCGLVYSVIIIAVTTLCIYGISVSIAVSYPLTLLIAFAITIILWAIFYGLAPKLMSDHKLSTARLMAPFLKALIKAGAPLLRATSIPSESIESDSYRKKQVPLANEAPNDMYEEKEMLEEIIHFYNKKANEIMTPRTDRSEERRVGKECRSRWSPYH